MSRRFALKRLTASDLTFFQWHHDNQKVGGNQKAVNLNADVFEEQLYPRLEPGSYKVGLTLIGPGDVAPLTMTRKILKNAAYKNWRLNGETVDKQQERFAVLRPGDYALMVFEGDQKPEDLKIVFVAKGQQADCALHKAMGRFISESGRQSMKALSVADVQAIAEEGNVVADHFLRVLVIDNDLIDAANGIDLAVQRFLTRVGRQARVDKETLQRARAQGEATGDLGESLVDIYLLANRDSGVLASYLWLARINAISPMDFEATDTNGVTESIEVKTTSGEFDRPFHVSLSELREAVTGSRTYRIYRVYGADSKGARLRVSNDLRPLARTILELFERLPAGVAPDGVTIAPSLLSFGKVIRLQPGD
jgi:hypothetical protein